MRSLGRCLAVTNIAIAVVPLLTGCSHKPSETPQHDLQAVSLSPSSGSGSQQTFVASYRHPNGPDRISTARVLINQTVDGRNACYVYYDRATASLLLVNDSGEGVSGVALKNRGRLSNRQCEVDAGASSASDSGDGLTVRFTLTFEPRFAGQKNIYLYVEDSKGKSTGFQKFGTWTTR